jgi:hypothetical protein
MATKNRLFAIIIMCLILVFSIIHLGVGSGIIAQNRNFGDLFRPEIGLSAFNIVLSILGLAVGAAGLFCILTNQAIISMFYFIV